MRTNKKIFRKTEISKVCAYLCVAGFALSGAKQSQALTYDVDQLPYDAQTLISSVEQSQNYLPGGGAPQQRVYGVGIYYDDANNSSSLTWPSTNGIAITVNRNVDLEGDMLAGSNIPEVSVYTYRTNSGDTVKFSDSTRNSILYLEGNNNLGGAVGVHVLNTGTAYSVTPDQLSSIEINNSNIDFAGLVFARDINLNVAARVDFYSDVNISEGYEGLTGNLNYLGNNSKVTFGDDIVFKGSITNVPTNGLASSGSELIFVKSATITGSVASSNTFIETVRVEGGDSLVTVGGNLSTSYLTYTGSGATVAVGSDLYLDVDTALGQNRVDFNQTNGQLQVGGNIIGVSSTFDTITTDLPNTGTLTMVGSLAELSGNVVGSAQSILGNVGSQLNPLLRVNIGGTGSEFGIDDGGVSTTTVNGHIYAQQIALNNFDGEEESASSHLRMEVGKNITGQVVTGANQLGNLTMLGGIQSVTGNIGEPDVDPGPLVSPRWLNTVTSGYAGGNASFNGNIFAANVRNEENGTSNYNGTVDALNVYVGAGVSYFKGNLTADETVITSGTGHFAGYIDSISQGLGTNNATITTDIRFAARTDQTRGVANLYNSLNGSVNFDGYDGIVNLSHDKYISGVVSASLSGSSTRNIVGGLSVMDAGEINALGAGELQSQVGATGRSIMELNVNTAGQQTSTGTTSYLLAEADVYAKTVRLDNSGQIRMASGTSLTTEQVVNGDSGQGRLFLVGGNNVHGNVGTNESRLARIDAGKTSSVDVFDNGIVYADTLHYQGTGTVIFRGSEPGIQQGGDSFSSNHNDRGFVGTVDFDGKAGVLKFGNNVDLITTNVSGGEYQTSFINANLASLYFEGNSVITGDLGSSNNAALENFADIYAGYSYQDDGEDTPYTVTFRNDVYVSATTFHVAGNGIVNLMGDLNGPLEFDAGADGSVNVANGKLITGTVTTNTDGFGTLNFVGGTTLQEQIGDEDYMLRAVNFHAQSTDGTVLPVYDGAVTVNIGEHVYSYNTNIGSQNPSASAFTTANITNDVFLGNALTLGSSQVTLNTLGTLSSYNPNGTLTFTNVTQSSTGTSSITTNGATLNFAIGTNQWASNAGGTIYTGTSLPAQPALESRSSRITGDEGSTLVMTGSENVNLTLLGSLRDGSRNERNDAYALINVDPIFVPMSEVDNNALNNGGALTDNSYVIDTQLTRGSDGDLLVTATRNNQVYIAKSSTTGHFSNPAALRLGTLAADGLSYGQDLQTVLNKLDIDQWGFGNNEANLAVQAKRLAPIANNSIGLSMFRTTSMVSDNIGLRMHEMRITEGAKPYDSKGFWIRSMYQQGKQNTLGAYDGFDSKISGFTMGIDARPNRDSIVGAALSYSNTKVEQRDFRAGDQATANAWHLSLYGAYDLTPEFFIDGTVTASTANLDSARATVVGRTAKADTDLNQITGKVNVGYRIKFTNSAATLTPMLSYEGSTLRQDAYSETGAGDIGLSTPSQRLNWNRAGVGLRLATTTMWGGMVAKPELTIMAQNENGNFAKPITSQFIGDYTNAAAFTTAVADKSAYSRSSLRSTLGLNLLMSKSSSLSVRYDHTNGDDFKSNAFDLMARWNF
jgi:outer membrane autotransporter protein